MKVNPIFIQNCNYGNNKNQTNSVGLKSNTAQFSLQNIPFKNVSQTANFYKIGLCNASKSKDFQINFTGISNISTYAKKVQKEKDSICMLLNYSLIHKNWQKSGNAKYRGFNIGAVLVNPQNEIVNTGLNTVWRDINATKHAEMNTIQTYLSTHPECKGNLENYTIYTSLEPCVMCSGSILQTNIGRVVYGLSDYEYGGAIPRLVSKDNGKYLFYETKHGKLKYQKANDNISVNMRKQFEITGKDSLNNVEWLEKDSVKKLFEKAVKQLCGYKVKYKENQNLLDSALSIYNNDGKFLLK